MAVAALGPLPTALSSAAPAHPGGAWATGPPVSWSTPGAVAAVVLVTLVASVAARWRPPPRRVGRALRSSRAGSLGHAAGRAGRVLARAVVLLAALVLWPPGAVLVAGWWLVAPRLRKARARRREADQLARSLPDVLDLLVLLLRGGQTVPLAVATLGHAAPPPFGPAFADVARRGERGQPLADALGGMAAQLGPQVHPLTSALVATERYGVALGPTLEQLAIEARRERRRLADIAARKLPVRLSFPLVCCILPAFGLLTVAPLLAGALGSLRV